MKSRDKAGAPKSQDPSIRMGTDAKGATAGYSGTPLWKKLGYRAGTLAYVAGEPEDYLRMLQLPSEITVRWAPRVVHGIAFVHFFTASKSALRKRLSFLRRRIAAGGIVWISWPKKSSGVETDITEDVVREVALPLGFVDIKVCAVNETWSGLKLMIRKELR